jgi:hypothetical protein
MWLVQQAKWWPKYQVDSASPHSKKVKKNKKETRDSFGNIGATVIGQSRLLIIKPCF